MTLLYCAALLSRPRNGRPPRAGRPDPADSGAFAAVGPGRAMPPAGVQPGRPPAARPRARPGLYRRDLGVRQVGRRQHRGRHGRQPRQLRRRPDGRRQRVRRRRAARPAAKTPRRSAWSARPATTPWPTRHGLLPVQQHRRGRPAGHRRTRAGARVDRRLGHPSRQRHAGRVLGRAAGRLPLDPPLPVLSRHGRRGRDGRRPRAGHDAQPAHPLRHARKTIWPSSATTWKSSPPRSSRNWCS